MALREVIFVRQLQDNGEQHEQLLNDVVMDVASKVLYFCPVGIDDLGLFSLKFWDELGYVEDLCVVEDAGLDFLQGVSTRRYPKTLGPCVYTNCAYSEAEGLVSIVTQVSPV